MYWANGSVCQEWLWGCFCIKFLILYGNLHVLFWTLSKNFTAYLPFNFKAKLIVCVGLKTKQESFLLLGQVCCLYKF